MNTEILNSLTILYVEDDILIQKNTVITLELLKTKVIDAKNGQEGIDKFKQNSSSIDIIITDISMPIMNGLDMIKEIQEINNDIPVIITTAHQDISYLKTAIELGITSYILKPVQIENIIDSVHKAMEPIKLKQELLKKNKELNLLNNSLEKKIQKRTQELELLASTDFLTGANNRRHFFKLAQERFDTSSNNLYAVMLDIDNFKSINDKYGHQVGDKVLVLIAKTILSKLDSKDIFGRVGGEEFAIIFNCDNDFYLRKIDEIRAIIENLRYENINFTISLGITQKYPSDKNLDTLLNRADKAMYDAKASGKNKTIFRNS